MSAGVGKTYAMLQAAQKKVQEGADVVVGIANTHGRPDTARLLEPLRQLPLRKIDYKGKEFAELDVDSLITLRPQLALVDELAHSNIPGSKHIKRWQDVMEILDHGIDVYTTVNVQHIESYKDIVEKITGIKIRETVPDLMLDKASYITCVDITPAELLQRLREGKVYTGAMTEVALRNFFQEERLTALREIALRCTAEVVDLELREMMEFIQKGKGWKPRERLLVAINHKSYSQQLIRTARRLSFNLHAPWVALYVDAGEKLDVEDVATLSKNLALARELGAEIVTTQDRHIADGIQRIAEERHITQIIIGKSLSKKLFKSSPVERLIKVSSGIDVHVIRQSELYPPQIKKEKGREVKRRKQEEASLAIYEIVKIISASPQPDSLLVAVQDKIGGLLQGSCVILVRDGALKLDFSDNSPLLAEEKERAVAELCFDTGKEAGWSTFTLPLAKNLYIPLKGFKEVVGVLVYHPFLDKPLLPEENYFLYTAAQQLAHFLERLYSEERERKNELLVRIEEIHAKLFHSLSNELFPPLQLMDRALGRLQKTQLESFEELSKAYEALMRIAEAASAMARLSGKEVAFEKSLHDMKSLVDSCIKKNEKILRRHTVTVRLQPGLPKVAVDSSLIEILLHHLLANAVNYSPVHSTIEIAAEVYDGTFVLSVADEGEGIPEGMADLVFEKFTRLKKGSSVGLGLGLAIVKSIANIHNGTIRVRNKKGGGAIFSLLLPSQDN